MPMNCCKVRRRAASWRPRLKNGDRDGIANVVRQFFHTQAGYEATLVLAQMEADQGHRLAAAQLYPGIDRYAAGGRSLRTATVRRCRAQSARGRQV